ncbi:hypothetical protein D3C85_1634070 [compost metagenome]
MEAFRTIGNISNLVTKTQIFGHTFNGALQIEEVHLLSRNIPLLLLAKTSQQKT